MCDEQFTHDLLVVIQYLISVWQTTTLRHQPSPTEKVVSSGRSSVVLWIRYRSLLGKGGNRSTLDRNRGHATERNSQKSISFVVQY